MVIIDYLLSQFRACKSLCFRNACLASEISRRFPLKLFHTRGFRMSAGFALALSCFLMLATSAFAGVSPSGNSTTSLAIAGSAFTLNVPATEDAGTVTLSTVDQTTSYTIPMTVNDPRGTGVGWDLTMTASQFTTGGGSPHTLPTSAQAVTSATQVCHTSSTCTLPDNLVPSYPLTLSSTAQIAYSAGTDKGMGEIDVTPTVQISVPANAYAGSYTSTVHVVLENIPG